MTNYPLFALIMDTMDAGLPEWRNEIAGNLHRAQQRQSGYAFSIGEHIRGMVLAMLSNQKDWVRDIAPKIADIDKIFCNTSNSQEYDATFILSKKPTYFENALREIKCGNRRISAQMRALPDNIRILQMIEQEWGSIDAFYDSGSPETIAKALSKSGQQYKLKELGMPLVCEYLKAMGINIVKPDLHLKRILPRLGYLDSRLTGAKLDNACIRVCYEICKEYNLTAIEVDAILWQFGVAKKLGICGATPKCDLCKAKYICPSSYIK